MKQRSHHLAAAFAVAAVLLLPLIELPLPREWRIASALIPICAYAVMGLGLNLVVGTTGLLNLGAAAFVAIGAYAFAIATTGIYPFQVGFWCGSAVAMAVAAAAGVAVALPALRLRGDYLAIVTLGFGEIAQDLLRNLPAITKGTQSIIDLPRPAFGAWSFAPTSQAWLPWYYLYLALLALALLALRNLERSRLGRSLEAIREDELAARCMGVRVERRKLVAFALSAALCGLAGAMLACALGSTAEPGTYDFNLSVLALCMVILGGMGSRAGVLLGALIMGGFNSIVLAKLDAAVGRWTGGAASANVLLAPGNWKYLVFGLTLILVMRLRPQGLLPPRRDSPATSGETPAIARSAAP